MRIFFVENFMYNNFSLSYFVGTVDNYGRIWKNVDFTSFRNGIKHDAALRMRTFSMLFGALCTIMYVHKIILVFVFLRFKPKIYELHLHCASNSLCVLAKKRHLTVCGAPD